MAQRATCSLMATCAMNDKMTRAAKAELVESFGASLSAAPEWHNGKMFFSCTAEGGSVAELARQVFPKIWQLRTMERVFVALARLTVSDVLGEAAALAFIECQEHAKASAPKKKPKPKGGTKRKRDETPADGVGAAPTPPAPTPSPSEPPAPPQPAPPIPAVDLASLASTIVDTLVADGKLEAAWELFRLGSLTYSESGASSTASAEAPPTRMPTFKVLCKRKGLLFGGSGGDSGGNRAEIAGEVGGGIHDATGWPVDVKDPDVTVVVTLGDDGVFAGLVVAKQVVNINYLGVTGETGLHPTVSWFIARCADPQPEDVVVDMVCGRGVILSELTGRWPRTHAVGLDISRPQLESSQRNFAAAKPRRTDRVDLILADSTTSVFRPSSVSAVLADLPFGKQHGSLEENRSLYPAVFRESLRVLLPGGRLVILTSTANRDTLKAALTHANDGATAGAYLHLTRRRWLRLGLLDAHVYVFTKEAADAAPAVDWSAKSVDTPFPWEGKSWAETYAKERPGMMPA